MPRSGASGRIVQDGADDKADVKDSDVIKAAIAILDRTGNGPTSTVNVQDADGRLDQILRERRRAMDDSEADPLCGCTDDEVRQIYATAQPQDRLRLLERLEKCLKPR